MVKRMLKATEKVKVARMKALNPVLKKKRMKISVTSTIGSLVM